MKTQISSDAWNTRSPKTSAMAIGLLAMALMAPPTAAQFPSFLDEPGVSIPDDDAVGVSTDISIGTLPLITGMQVMLRIDHEDTGQLEVELKHVELDITVKLLEFIGDTIPPSVAPSNAENDGMWINLSDDGFTTIDTADLDFIPPASIEGSFSPDGSLSAFTGKNPSGTWRLTVKDRVTGVVGTVAAWSLSFNSPWTDMGLGLPGSSSTSTLLCAGALTPLSPYSLSILDAEESVPGILFVGIDMLPYPTPFKDGVFGPFPIMEVLIPTDAFGNQFIPGTWPSGVPTGFDLYIQYWYFDEDMPKNVAATNTVAAVTP
jgi:subtilisin-like proprotein convertase family protein